MESDYFKYWAFLSYSHRDEHIAAKLHKALETYRVPGKIVGRETTYGRVPKRAYPVFRDREELPSSADLGKNIEDSLRNAHALVVVCSPQAAKSRWVNEEILRFKQMGREDHVLALIVDGEPNASDKHEIPGLEEECFPQALRYAVNPDGSLGTQRVEPIAADLRRGKDGWNNATLKLIAGLLGIPYAELNDREQKRRKQRALGAVVACTCLLFILAGLWMVQERKRLVEVRLEQAKTQIERDEALNNLSLAYAEKGRNKVAQADNNLGRLYYLKALGTVPEGNRGPGWSMAVEGMLNTRSDPPVYVSPTAVYHAAGITCAVFSPDGKLLATGSKDNTIKIWHYSTGRLVKILYGHSSSINHLVFSPDGTLLASGGGNKSIITGFDRLAPDFGVRIWSTDTWECTHVLFGHGSSISNLEFAPDGKTLCSGDNGGGVRAWDMETAKMLWTHAFAKDAHVDVLRFSPESERVLLGANATHVDTITFILLDTRSGKMVFEDGSVSSQLDLPEQTGSPTYDAVFLSEDMLAICAGNKGFMYQTGDSLQPVPKKQMTTRPEDAAAPCRVLLSPTKETLVVATHDSITARASTNGNMRASRALDLERVPHLAFSPDSKHVVATGTNLANVFVNIVDIETGSSVTRQMEGSSQQGKTAIAQDGKSFVLIQDGLRTLDVFSLPGMKNLDTRPGARSGLLRMVLSPEGTWCLTAESGAYRLWNVLSGTQAWKSTNEMRLPKLHQGIFSTTEPVLATIWNELEGARDRLGLYDYAAKKWLPVPAGLARLHGVKDICFSGNGKYFAVLHGYPGEVLVWDTVRKRTMLRVGVGSADQIRFSRTGNKLFTVRFNKLQKVYDVTSGAVLAQFPQGGANSTFTGYAFSKDGTLVAWIGKSIKEIELLNVVTGGTATLRWHKGMVTALEFSPDNVLYSADLQGNLIAWPRGKPTYYGKQRAQDISKRESILSIAFNPTGESFSTGGYYGTINVWPHVPNAKHAPLNVLPGHTARITSLAYGPYGSFLLSSSDDGTWRVWDTGGGTRGHFFNGLVQSQDVVRFNATGTYVACSTNGGNTQVFDVDTGRLVEKLPAQKQLPLDFLSSGVLAYAKQSGIGLWSPTEGRLPNVKFSPDESHIRALVASPVEEHVAVSLSDKSVRLVDVATGKELKQFSGHGEIVNGLAFSVDGTLLAGASDDSTVRIWRVATGQVVHVLRGHRNGASCVAFSPDGTSLASGGGNYRFAWPQDRSGHDVRLWDVDTGKLQRVLTGLQGVTRKVQFTPDGKYVVAGAADFITAIWGVGAEVDSAEAMPIVRLTSMGVFDVADHWAGKKLRMALSELRGKMRVLDISFLAQSPAFTSVAHDAGLWDMRIKDTEPAPRKELLNLFTAYPWEKPSWPDSLPMFWMAAAQREEAAAMAGLGACYERMGIDHEHVREQTFSKARAWYERAEARGDTEAGLRFLRLTGGK